ncbi:hypothetical protein [Streptomyces sp. NPDC000410]|uniref:hypothetical protein n=1 Tax=Streptomyces sp. NPDC000410 TaxID=3154254 RepID=UPI003328B9F2
MRTNRVLLAAAAAVMAFALAGCGDDGGAKLPTAGGGGASGTGGGTDSGKDVVAEYVEGKRAWVRCMRENGIQLNDPDEKGQIDFGGGDSVRSMTKNPKFVEAARKCESVDPPAPEGLEKILHPYTPEEIKIKREYATCMQKNGAPDFPDPGPDGHNNREAQWDQDSAGARRAARVCGPIIGVPSNPPSAKG